MSVMLPERNRMRGKLLQKIGCQSREVLAWLAVLLFLAVSVLHMLKHLEAEASYAVLDESPAEGYAFRNMSFSPERLRRLQQKCREQSMDWLSLWTAGMLDADFVFGSEEPLDDLALRGRRADGYEARMPEAFAALRAGYAAVLADLACFPVPLSDLDADADVAYENSWMYERSFGGIRGHEGTDLMPSVKEAGRYPVLSMTDGVVEKIGWLERGGWRIGIRSPHGGYFYYAHLSSYAREFREGDPVRAGEMLGYMGNTGYGPEGTTGQFDVHLHLGIYLQTEHHEELSVNPYWILRFLEPSRRSCHF